MKQTIVKGDSINKVSKLLSKGKTVKATGLGKFRVVQGNATRGYDVVTGKVIKRKASKRIKFSVTKSLKKSLQQI